MLKVPLNAEKFFLEAHMKLRPVDFATEGIYLAGMAHAPKFIEESIAQACAAVSRACTVLAQDELMSAGLRGARRSARLCRLRRLCQDLPVQGVATGQQRGHPPQFQELRRDQPGACARAVARVSRPAGPGASRWTALTMCRSWPRSRPWWRPSIQVQLTVVRTRAKRKRVLATGDLQEED